MVSFMKIKLKSLLMRMRRKILSRSWKIVSKKRDGREGRLLPPPLFMQDPPFPVPLLFRPNAHVSQEAGWLYADVG